MGGEGLGVQFHWFLTCSICDKWPTSSPGCFITGKEAQYALMSRLSETFSRSGRFGSRESLFPSSGLEHRVVRRVALRCTDFILLTPLHRKINLWKFKVVFAVDSWYQFSSTHMSTKTGIGLDTQCIVTDTDRHELSSILPNCTASHPIILYSSYLPP